MHRLASVVGMVLVLSCNEFSSGRGAAAPQVRGRGERDLDCPAADIRLQEELGGRYLAIGCGRKAYYRTACENLRCDVRAENEGAIPWKDRPEPDAPPRP